MNKKENFASVKLIVFDFDGVFTDNMVYVDQNGIETVRCWRSDGLGLSRLKEVGVKTFIISTESNPVVSVRANKLKIACKQSVEDKSLAILAICEDFDIDPRNTMFVGNDINDIPAFKSVGIAVAVSDAYPEVDPYILFRTNRPGGFGAVREVFDLVFYAKMDISKI